MIDEENKSATMTEAPAAATAVPAHAAPAGSKPVEPEDTCLLYTSDAADE